MRFSFSTATCTGVVAKGNIANSVGTVYTNTANIPVGQLNFAIGFGVGIPPGHGALANNGYRVHPDGSIEQWGQLTLNTNASTGVTFNTNGVNFPSACFGVVATLTAAPGSNTVDVTAQSTTGFTIIVAGTAGSNTLFWRAVGN